MSSKMSESFKEMLNGATALLSTKTVVGDPYVIGDTTIVPFLELAMGMGVGDFNEAKGAGGMGCKVTPVACLVIKDDTFRLLHIKDQDVIVKALDLIPELVDKMTGNEVITDEIKTSVKNLEKKPKK